MQKGQGKRSIVSGRVVLTNGCFTNCVLNLWLCNMYAKFKCLSLQYASGMLLDLRTWQKSGGI